MLAEAGYTADTIDAILLTHVHGDHSGGIAVGDRRVFPNADPYLPRREHDFWTSDAEQARARPQHRKMFIEGRAALAPYAAAERIRLFDGPVEIFPGISALPAPGHTLGHDHVRFPGWGHITREGTGYAWSNVRDQTKIRKVDR